jgi:hypothetical protein
MFDELPYRFSIYDTSLETATCEATYYHNFETRRLYVIILENLIMTKCHLAK